ncbi:phosphate/phosphite/phosphonate ABC transporter substrate-binding protein [Nesterenkonia sp. MY13]|uniref:Phosphate/phosphite/phosphonate ABC transporter substrate-binding protein n=1 Tax=Nesterenkonia sedimenti TaxID=1463632 RepID=A0A7X8TIP9_9MICC|nr:phosphate/phosphite/phosphonate ABC transporter substrate-binding protein [Nesterenkonia sedimenti]NLS09419.1 phosphate/phosphite/phosphonate ABC transporter substrate-binding protein [Nesterenkonia sedimenti]
MRMNTKSAFALASVLTLTLAACAGDEEDLDANGDEDEETTDTDDTDTNGDDNGDAEAAGEITSVDSITIGLVPATESATEAEEENADALAEELSEALGGFPVDIFFADSYLGVISGMQTGDVQLVMSGPVGMIQAEDEADGTPILQSIRYGSDNYVTQWFTNDPDTYCLDDVVQDEEGYSFCNGIYDEESGEFAEYGPMGEDALELIEDGTSVAYVEEGSASGFYFPQTQLNDLGVEVDAQFAGGHDQAVTAVYNGDFPIGTSFDDARQNIEDENPDVGEELVVFAWAGPIPNDGIVASNQFDDEELQVLTDAWLSFAESGDLDEGDPLYDVYEINGLAPADEEALDVARQVYLDFGDE